jgi:hypothetical protein
LILTTYESVNAEIEKVKLWSVIEDHEKHWQREYQKLYSLYRKNQKQLFKGELFRLLDSNNDENISVNEFFTLLENIKKYANASDYDETKLQSEAFDAFLNNNKETKNNFTKNDYQNESTNNYNQNNIYKNNDNNNNSSNKNNNNNNFNSNDDNDENNNSSDLLKNNTKVKRKKYRELMKSKLGQY